MNQTVTFNGNVLERNVIEPSRNKAFVYDAGYGGDVVYQRCLFVATDNVFRAANNADVGANNGNVFSRFPDSEDAFSLYVKGNVDEGNHNDSQQ